MSISSPSCPLCRKPYVASHIIKLHVDRPATSEQGVEDVELLQRLDAEEAKRQVELEAAVEQSKQRKRALRESLERARRSQKQRSEEAEVCEQQPPTVTGKSASDPILISEVMQIDEVYRLLSESSVTRAVVAAAPPLTRWGRGEGGGWRARRDTNADATTSLVSSAAPPSTRWGRGEGGRRATWDTNADLTSSSASLIRAPLRVVNLDAERSVSGYQ